MPPESHEKLSHGCRIQYTRQPLFHLNNILYLLKDQLPSFNLIITKKKKNDEKMKKPLDASFLKKLF